MRVGYIVPSLDDDGMGPLGQRFLRHIAEAGVASVVLAPPSSARHLENLTCAESHFVLPEFFDYLQSSTGERRLPALAAFRSGVAGRLQSAPVAQLARTPDAERIRLRRQEQRAVQAASC